MNRRQRVKRERGEKRSKWRCPAQIVLVLVIIAWGLCIGPWPVYTSRVGTEKALSRSSAAVRKAFEVADAPSAFAPLQAGWARGKITPSEPIPLAGYGARRGRRSDGIAQDLFVKAVVLEAGGKKAVLLGADLLLIPDNMANPVRTTLFERNGLTADEIFFSATHTHSAPNPWRNIPANLFTGGAYEAEYGRLVQDAMLAAVEAALSAMGPAEIGIGHADGSAYVRNRMGRKAAIDDRLEYVLLRKESGEQCLIVNFSAHPTVLGSDNMAVAGDYPGYLRQSLSRDPGLGLLFMAGAVGGAGPIPPAVSKDMDMAGIGMMNPAILGQYERAAALGEALAERIRAALPQTETGSRLFLRTAAAPITLPPSQIRISQRWRISPFLPRLLGLAPRGTIQAIGINELILLGLPIEVSAEISRIWKAGASVGGAQLWVSSFSSDYRGYLSPDAVYGEKKKDGSMPYELGLVSFGGPYQEFFFNSLVARILDWHRGHMRM